MIDVFRGGYFNSRLWVWTVITVVLLGAIYLGSHPSILSLALVVGGIALVVLLRWPILGVLAIIPAALIGRMEVGTGTAVAINPTTLLVPAVLTFWVVDMVLRDEVCLTPSRTNRPLWLFLLAGLVSFLVGNALWNPAVPRSSNFLIVQLAQWAVFAFSAGAYWLTGNIGCSETWLKRLTFLFLTLAGSLAILRVIPATADLVRQTATFALDRAPFWMLLAALVGGQLLFNKELRVAWRLFLLISLGAVLIYVFFLERATASNWVGVATVAGVLFWLRFPQLRWLVVLLLVVLAANGLLFSSVYTFAGGEAEWEESGGSRMVLINRVIEVTMRNPITGLGPAAYRPYAAMKPLPYGQAFWTAPQINSHNNYVDLFSHVGLVGLTIFFWFTIEVIRLGLRLRAHYPIGFAAGYVNAVLAAWAGALVLMVFADWILPFVYNIGFPGFQASVLVWLFLGGLVALEQIARREATS